MSDLTTTEKRIILLLEKSSCTYPEIAFILNISLRSIYTHVYNIRQKVDNIKIEKDFTNDCRSTLILVDN